MDNPGRATLTLEKAKLKQHSFEFFFPVYSWSTALDCQQFSRLQIGTEMQSPSLFTPWRDQLYMLID